MTETEWLAGNDPVPMLEFIYDSDCGSDRKLRLFGVACCRRTWHVLRDVRSREAVDVAERYADGQATEEEIRAAREIASEASGLGRYGGDDSWGRDSFPAGLELAAKAAAWAATWRHAGSVELSDAAATAAVPTWAERVIEFSVQADLIRCIFGPLPFRGITVSPSCSTATVVSLARTIYDQRDFERIPILADALEEASCDDTEVLRHCRGPGPHARGCWVVDAILGKD